MAEEPKVNRILLMGNRSAVHALVATKLSEGMREKYEKQYDTLKSMPPEVLANRVVAAIAHARTIEWVGIIAQFVERMRAEYRQEGELQELRCRDCDSMTTHRTEKMDGIGTPGDFITRCTICGKVAL
jgi:hypothetical protein